MGATTTPEVRAYRLTVAAWFRHALTLEQAKDRQLVPLSRRTYLHRWSQRTDLYEFAKQASQASPVLVMVSPNQAALYTARPTKK
jgi:hypothetical protein